MSIGTDALDELYATVKPKGVTMTALLAKAVGAALAQHPLLYATLSSDATSITYNEKARSPAADRQSLRVLATATTRALPCPRRTAPRAIATPSLLPCRPARLYQSRRQTRAELRVGRARVGHR